MIENTLTYSDILPEQTDIFIYDVSSIIGFEIVWGDQKGPKYFTILTQNQPMTIIYNTIKKFGPPVRGQFKLVHNSLMFTPYGQRNDS